MASSGNSLLRALLVGSALCPAAPALAETTWIDLGTITLLGTGLPTEVLTNPASITVIEGDSLQKKAPVSIATLLRDVPGLMISEEGIERIVIRGESSRRVAILVDGQKLTDHTDYGQPVLVDPTTIERIEVVRGSSSVVSGSRAIGGVINIITKKGAERPFALTTTGGWFSATDGYRLSATASGSFAAGAGVLDYRFSAGHMDQGNRRAPEGLLVPSDTQDSNLSTHLGYRLGDHYFGLRTQRYDVAGNVYVEDFDPLTGAYTPNPDFTINLPKRELNKVAAFYEGTDLTPWLERLSFDVYRQTTDRLFSTRARLAPAPLARLVSDSDDRQLTFGANLRAEMRFSERTRTVIGLEYEDDRLTADKFTLKPMDPNPESRYDEAKIVTTSVFAQHEISLGHDVTLTLGGRWYGVQADQLVSTTNGAANPLRVNKDSRALFSAGLVWMPAEDLSFRANISQGYIYPTLGQLFLISYADRAYIHGNPDLRPERSTTFELGARLDRGGTLIDATLFYADATDYIAKIGGTTKIYQNVDTARTWGLELAAEHRIENWGLTPYVTGAVMRRELGYASGYTTTDSGTPRLSGRIGLRKDWEAGAIWGTLDLFVRAESGAALREGPALTDLKDKVGGYGTLNLRADINFSEDFALAVELNNITDRSYKPYDQMPGAERSVNLFLTKTF